MVTLIECHDNDSEGLYAVCMSIQNTEKPDSSEDITLSTRCADLRRRTWSRIEGANHFRKWFMASALAPSIPFDRSCNTKHDQDEP